MKKQQQWVRDYDLKQTVYRIGDACVWLSVCWRSGPLFGQFEAHAHGIPDFDPVAEGFPRYYMQKDRAQAEVIAWLHHKTGVRRAA